MAAWTRADVRNVAPEFASTADGTIDKWIALVEPKLNADLFGSLAVQAGAFLTAHHLKRYEPSPVGSGGAVGGVVTGVTVGQVSVSYAAPQALAWAHLDLGSTIYGQAFMSMIPVSVGFAAGD